MAHIRRQQRDILLLRLPDGREIELLRVVDPRARNLRLLIAASGPRLTIPPAASATEARVFLERHLYWLADQLAEDPRALTNAASPQPGQPGTLLLRGQALTLEWHPARWLQVAQKADRLVIGVPAATRPETVRQGLREFLLTEARADVGRWLPRHLASLPRSPRQWRIRPLSSLWGSLSPSGAMSLDLALVLAPPAAFEYVLVHELCHLLQPNHSAAFWREVERRFPSWRTQRDWLREDGLTVKGELRRLLG